MRSLLVVAAALIFMQPATADESGDQARIFLFVGEPNATAWKLMMDNPADREKEVAAGMAAIGGKVLSYYFGLGNGKNYITVQLPDDNEVIQAVYLMRLPSGLLESYEVIELMPSDQMTNALKRSKEYIEMEKELGDGVQ